MFKSEYEKIQEDILHLENQTNSSMKSLYGKKLI